MRAHWYAQNQCIAETDTLHSHPHRVALLKDVTSNSILVRQRQIAVDQRKKKYNWQVFPDSGMPSAIDMRSKNLTSDEQFGTVKGIDFTKDAISAAVTLQFTAAFTEIKSLSQFEQLATAMGKPEFPTFEISRWTHDEEFGRQILNGVNPVIIERCSSLPPNFPVTNAMVDTSMDRNLSLDDAMKVD